MFNRLTGWGGNGRVVQMEEPCQTRGWRFESSLYRKLKIKQYGNYT